MKPQYAFLASAALLAAAPAEAATYLITYTGTVSSGYDHTGEFGAPGQLDGLSFTAIYTLTAPLPGAVTYDDGTLAYTYGGAAYLAPSTVSAALTINGMTRTITGEWFSQAYQFNGWDGGGNIDYVYHQADHHDGDSGAIDGTYYYDIMYSAIYSPVHDFLATQDYTAPLSYSLQPGDGSNGYFNFYGYGDFGNNIYRNASGYLQPTSVTIALSSPGVPEPATWAMMILGFALVGGAMRRRERAALAAA